MNEIKHLVEVKLLADEKIIRESLSRVGIGNKKKKVLFPSCYLYKNFEKFYIVHFKEMFLLSRSNGYNNISEKDLERKNSIIFCLQNWKLVDVVNQEEIEPHNEFVFVLPHKCKNEWEIHHKWNVNSEVVD